MEGVIRRIGPAAPAVSARGRRLLVLAANGVALAWLVFSWVLIQGFINEGIDAHAYWLTRDGIEYGRAGELDAYLYSPVFAQVISPLTLLDWPAFYAVWTGMLIGALVYIVGPIGAGLLMLLRGVSGDVVVGNIHIFLAAALCAGLRHHGAWSFVLLTKVTPGVGLLYHLLRREWRPMGIALGVTAGLVAVSFALDPGAWFGWFGALSGSSSTPQYAIDIPLVVRLPIAVLIVAVGAWRGWYWSVIVAGAIAVPVMWGLQNRWAIILIALVPFLWQRVRDARA